MLYNFKSICSLGLGLAIGAGALLGGLASDATNQALKFLYN